MRSNLELWEIVRDNFDEYFRFGLCSLLLKLYRSRFFSLYEYITLEDELKEYINIDRYSLGKEGDPKPRKEFIKKMIKKYSKNGSN